MCCAVAPLQTCRVARRVRRHTVDTALDPPTSTSTILVFHVCNPRRRCPRRVVRAVGRNGGIWGGGKGDGFFGLIVEETLISKRCWRLLFEGNVVGCEKYVLILWWYSSYGVGYKIDRVNLMDWLDETVCFEVESWFLIVDYRWNVRCIIYMYV